MNISRRALDEKERGTPSATRSTNQRPQKITNTKRARSDSGYRHTGDNRQSIYQSAAARPLADLRR
ncbi:hypothetical protein ABMA28_017045 [Loxostege sticticalis]|uniref:Uncharacterized protein n=1 Tax=Loxostege sticticalis TaxID=481309 RepID=A0ABD0T709_LOXSC